MIIWAIINDINHKVLTIQPHRMHTAALSILSHEMLNAIINNCCTELISELQASMKFCEIAFSLNKEIWSHVTLTAWSNKNEHFMCNCNSSL